MTPAERRKAHEICGVTALGDSPFDTAEIALEQAYALLAIIQLAARECGQEFGLLNPLILSRAFDGLEHLIAEAHFQLYEMQ